MNEICQQYIYLNIPFAVWILKIGSGKLWRSTPAISVQTNSSYERIAFQKQIFLQTLTLDCFHFLITHIHLGDKNSGVWVNNNCQTINAHLKLLKC